MPFTTVELIGGARDGETIVVRELMPEIRFPIYKPASRIVREKVSTPTFREALYYLDIDTQGEPCYRFMGIFVEGRKA